MTTTAMQDRFLALLDQHKKILFKVAGAYCRNPADRPDLMQEITAQLWRSFYRYDERHRFSTWMYRIALNVAISFYRSESRRSRNTVPAEDAILDLAAEGPEPGDEDGNLQLLHQLIARLDELDRALVLLYLDGNRYDIIAEILGISATNAATKLSRIKQRLRRDLAQTA
jgi:RNA polymerase sigma-70 factor (ECF subfamily)